MFAVGRQTELQQLLMQKNPISDFDTESAPAADATESRHAANETNERGVTWALLAVMVLVERSESCMAHATDMGFIQTLVLMVNGLWRRDVAAVEAITALGQFGKESSERRCLVLDAGGIDVLLRTIRMDECTVQPTRQKTTHRYRLIPHSSAQSPNNQQRIQRLIPKILDRRKLKC